MFVNVKNRSNNTVIYNIPDGNVRRTFSPLETKQISSEELQKLVYQPGGPELLAGYLVVEDKKLLAQLLGVPQPEYWLDEAGVVRMLTEASLDEFLDCLDFAPPGVLEMIQEKIQQLNQEIAENRYLGQGLVLGHSYFTPQQKIYDEKNWYQDVIESEVLPLLEDYCADDAMQLDKWQTDLLDLQ